jgi:acylphosphatase
LFCTFAELMKAVHLKIYGVVQGVFFRQHTLEKAKEHGINGWVRNCTDGTVEAEAEGEEDALLQFIEWCHEGPQRAEVDKVDVTPTTLKNFFSFQIRR